MSDWDLIKMIVDCVSDLHGHYPKLEGGDLLIIAGDLTAGDVPDQHEDFCEWLDSQPYEKKIVVAGNHDKNVDVDYLESMCHVAYLQDSGTEFEGLKIWGSPWTKRFEGMNPHCMAFTCENEEELAEKWAMIPEDTDILATHSPPYGILDRVDFSEGDSRSHHVGSKSLALKVGLMKNPPRLWVWGHIHESYGRDLPVRAKPCIMVNASHVNERYEPVNKPVRIVL